MKVLIIDSQGGGVGKSLIEGIRKNHPDLSVIAVGTNAAATSAMLKAGASGAATGENAVIVNARDADIIAGPLGIVIADSMLGEVSPAIANAVASSSAKKILIPFDHCGKQVVGLRNLKLSDLIELAVQEIEKFLD